MRVLASHMLVLSTCYISVTNLSHDFSYISTQLISGFNITSQSSHHGAFSLFSTLKLKVWPTTYKNNLVHIPSIFVTIYIYKNPEIYLRVTMPYPSMCISANKYKILSKYVT
jgi:hypothetical protein